MSRTGGMHGAGGYGGVSTLNQRDVRPRYSPHLAISKTTDHLEDLVEVKCLDCGIEWAHPRGAFYNPPECKKPQKARQLETLPDTRYRP